MQTPVPPTVISDGYFIPFKTGNLFVQGDIECQGSIAATDLVSSTGLINIDTNTPTTGQVLTATSSSVATWQTPSSGGTPGGSNTQIQYNSSGVFGGNSNLTFSGSDLAVGGKIAASSTSTINPYGALFGGAITTAGGINISKDLYIGGVLYLNDKESVASGPHSMGEAVLPGGSPNSVTVTSTTLDSFGRVFITVSSANGTLGNLYVNNLGAGSFTINSSSTTETSSVSWMVVRYVGLCFHADSIVELKSGIKMSLNNLKYGDYVLSHFKNGRKIYSPVISFSGWDLESIGSSIEITTDNKHRLIVSDTHLIYSYSLDKYVKACELKIDDYVLINSEPKKITMLSQGAHSGWISPLTKSGKIYVNGFATSCHTHDVHNLVRFIYLPLRLYLRIFPNTIGTQPKGNSNFSIYYRRGPIGKMLTLLFKPFFS